MKKVSLGIIIIFLIGCASLFYGNYPSKFAIDLYNKINSFSQGTTTKEEAIEVLGEPTKKHLPIVFVNEKKEVIKRIDVLEYYNPKTRDFCRVFFVNGKFYDYFINDPYKNLDILRSLGLLSDTDYWNYRNELNQYYAQLRQEEILKKQMILSIWANTFSNISKSFSTSSALDKSFLSIDCYQVGDSIFCNAY